MPPTQNKFKWHAALFFVAMTAGPPDKGERP